MGIRKVGGHPDSAPNGNCGVNIAINVGVCLSLRR